MSRFRAWSVSGPLREKLFTCVGVGNRDGRHRAVLGGLQDQFFSVAVGIGGLRLPLRVQIEGFGCDGDAHCIAHADVVVNGHGYLSCHVG